MEWILIIAVIFLGIGIFVHRSAIDQLAERVDTLEEKVGVED